MNGHRHHHPRRKTGLPPGSLVHTGERKTRSPSLSLLRYDQDQVSPSQPESPAGIAPPGPGEHLWLNVDGIHDPALMAEIGTRFGLHPLVQEDIMNPHQRPKVEDYGSYLYFVVHLFEACPDQDELLSDQISIVLGHDFVLTFQERKGDCFAPIRERLSGARATLRREGSGYLAYALLDAVIDRYFLIADWLGERAEQIEDEALENPRRDLLARINRVKRDTLQVRRAVWPLREVLNGLIRGEDAFFNAATQLYLRDVYDHTVHVIEILEAVRDLLADLVDIYLSSVSNRLNLELRVLTVLTTLFMPASLIAGIFGMNFRYIPLLESHSGFALALALMALIATAMAALFWRRNWLRS